jgi:hypothetical protein
MLFQNKEFSNIGNKVLIPSGVQTACAGKQKHRSRLQASANTKKRVAGEETGEYRDKEEDIPHVPVT